MDGMKEHEIQEKEFCMQTLTWIIIRCRRRGHFSERKSDTEAMNRENYWAWTCPETYKWHGPSKFHIVGKQKRQKIRGC